MQAALTSRWGNAHSPGPGRLAIPPRHQERRWAGAGGTSLFCPTTLPAAGSRGPESWCQNRLVTWEPCPRPLQPQTGPPSSGAGTARGMALLGEWQRQEHEQGQAPLAWRCGEGGSVWDGGDTGLERRGRVEGGGAHPGSGAAERTWAPARRGRTGEHASGAGSLSVPVHAAPELSLIHI